jgi:hypothetical protein
VQGGGASSAHTHIHKARDGKGEREAHAPPHWSLAHLEGLMWQQAAIVDPPAGAPHTGFSPGEAVYERRAESRASIRDGEGKRYYYSGFFGGARHAVFELLSSIARNSEVMSHVSYL